MPHTLDFPISREGAAVAAVLASIVCGCGRAPPEPLLPAPTTPPVEFTVAPTGTEAPPEGFRWLGRPEQRFHDQVGGVGFLDERRVSAIGFDGALLTWEVASGKLLHRLVGPRSPRLGFATLRGGAVALGGPEGFVQVVDPVSGATIRVLSGARPWTGPGPRPRIRALAASPDSARLAAVTGDGYLVLWELSSGKLLGEIQVHTSMPNKVAWTSDGRFVLSCAAEADLVITDPTGPHVVRRTSAHPERGFFGASTRSLAPIGSKRVASVGVAPELRIWDIATGEKTGTIPLPEKYSPLWLEASPDGASLALAGLDGELRLFDVATLTQVASIPESALKGATKVAFSASGNRLAVSAGMAVLLFDRPSHTSTFDDLGHRGIVGRLVSSPDGKVLASSSYDGTIRFWNPLTGALLGTVRSKVDQLEVMEFVGDGSRLEFNESRTLRAVEVPSGKELSIPEGFTRDIPLVDDSPPLEAPGGQWSLIRTADDSLEVHSATGTRVLGPIVRDVKPWGYCFSARGDWVAIAYQDGAILAGALP